MHKFIFIGAPGVGKGTYAKRISPKMGIPHVASGDLFRAEIAKQSELGKLAQSYIDQGKLVPDDVTVAMMKERLAQPDAQKGFILDGFPRNLEQAKVLEKITPIDLVVHFVLPEEAMIKRACARRICEKCGEVFNLMTFPPKQEGICDKCGGKLIQRSDDNEKTIRQRLMFYHKLTDPIIAYYNNKNLVKVFEGQIRQNPDEVAMQVMKLLQDK